MKSRTERNSTLHAAGERNHARRTQLTLVLCALAIVWASWSASRLWWTTDDAFISFRYAQNLVEGRGLVFNPGEYVEGYTNPLWTLWAAAGLKLGASAENWSNVWGLLSYIGSIALLALNGHALLCRGSGAGQWLPLAALGAALHHEWQVFAVSGLETAPFTLLLLGAYMLVVWNRDRPAHLAAAGALFALAALTRHDGVIPAVVSGIYVVLFSPRRWRAATCFGLAFAALWIPFTAWRVSYYGDLFPNSYYAKSAYLTWYSQGLLYLGLYLQKYWALALGPVLTAGALGLRRLRGARWNEIVSGERQQQLLLSTAIAAAYVFYVVRVGGDFMFGRFLIPATPFLLILFESGFELAFPRRPVWGNGLAAAALIGMVLTPPPVTGSDFRHGVANEWAYYSAQKVADLDHSAEVLGRYFAGLPVRVAFYGDEARVVYKARFSWAVESSAGLNDPKVARQELAQRGRPGHEKYPSATYLVDDLRVHFTFSRVPQHLIRLDRYIPTVEVRFDEDVWGRVLHWDPELMAALRRRGAQFWDFVSGLDQLIAHLDRMDPEEVAEQYERVKRFYFDPVGDPAREAAFKRHMRSE